MKQTFAFILLACILLSSCNSTQATAKPEQLTVQYTAASVPWLAGVYRCAGQDVVTAEQRGADFLNPSSADMIIRVGRPDNPSAFAFQIASDDLQIIINLKNPSRKITAAQVDGIFSGQIQNWKAINGTDAPVEVWVYPAVEDVQEIFGQSVLHGSPVTSAAHLANNPNEVLQEIEKDVNAIGIISGRWKNGKVNGIYTAASGLPVLAITLSKPEGRLAQIIACMQK